MKIDPSIPGWSTRAKLVNIANVSSILEARRKNPRILEIGVWAGRSLYHWAANAPSAEVVALDPGLKYNLTDLKMQNPKALEWLDGDTHKWNMWEDDIEIVRRSVIKKCGLTNVRLYDIGSNEYFEKPSLPFDVIYVDGDHSTEQVYKDLVIAHSVLKKGGIVCGDDYGWDTVRAGIVKYQNETGKKICLFDGMDMWAMYDEKSVLDFWFPNVVDSSSGIR